jgi:hypothetical protein
MSTTTPAPDGDKSMSMGTRRFRAAESLKMFVPLTNANAVWAYYFGIASLIPFSSLVRAIVKSRG